MNNERMLFVKIAVIGTLLLVFFALGVSEKGRDDTAKPNNQFGQIIRQGFPLKTTLPKASVPTLSSTAKPLANNATSSSVSPAPAQNPIPSPSLAPSVPASTLPRQPAGSPSPDVTPRPGGTGLSRYAFNPCPVGYQQQCTGQLCRCYR